MNLIDRLKKHEGSKRGKNGLHELYKDSENLWTIGYGILVEPGMGGLYEEEAEYLLKSRFEKALTQAQTLPWFKNIDQGRQEVVVEMIFNMGLYRFMGFKNMIAALQRQDYSQAAKDGLDSKWAKQVKGRADTLMKIMEKGE